MNVSRFSSLASLTPTSSAQIEGIFPGCAPTHTIRSRGATLPSGARFPGHELGLPFGHTPVSAEDAVGMEVARWPGNVRAAPLTRTGLAVSASRVGAPNLCALCTLPGTDLLGSLPRAVGRLSTNHARPLGRISPPRAQVTGARTEARAGPPVLRVEGAAAPLAVKCDVGVSHTGIISLEERYCEVATNRMSQEVLL